MASSYYDQYYNTPPGTYSAVSNAVSGAQAPGPQLLTNTQRQNLFSNIQGQTDVATKNALASAANSMGGVTNPAYAAKAARINAGAGASEASQESNALIQQQQAQAGIDMQQRSQGIEAGQLALSQSGQAEDMQKFLDNLAFQNTQYQGNRQDSRMQFLASLVSGAGGSGGSGSTGGGTGLASDMNQEDQYNLMTGNIPRSEGAFNKLTLDKINQQRLHPDNFQNMLQELTQAFGWGQQNLPAM